MLALAALRLDEVERATRRGGAGAQATADVKSALNDALRDMRSIAAGLRLPELRAMSSGDAVRRAVDDHQRRTSVPSAVDIGELPREAPLSTKIALFRATQELLSNATRHGQGKDVSVKLDGDTTRDPLDRQPTAARASTRRASAPRVTLASPASASRRSCWAAASRSARGPDGGASITVRWPL